MSSRKPVILPNTTLATIVKDEAENIEPFCHATLPHVRAAVIFDAGSTDGTATELARMAYGYPHLEVYHAPQGDPVELRNAALSRVATKRALVLNADERVQETDWENIAACLRASPDTDAWAFSFVKVYKDGSTEKPRGYQPRLFDVGIHSFDYVDNDNSMEWLMWTRFPERAFQVLGIPFQPEGATIFHLIPNNSVRQRGIDERYQKYADHVAYRTGGRELVGSAEWVAHNSRRGLGW